MNGVPTYTGLNVYLYCDNPEKSAAFYQALGFRLAQHFPEMDVYALRVGSCNFVVGPQQGETEAARAWLAARPWGRGVLLMPGTPDVDAVHRAALAAGATIVEPPTDKPWGSRTLTIEDPDGYRLMFEQELAPPPAAKAPVRRKTGKSAARRVKPAKVAKSRGKKR